MRDALIILEGPDGAGKSTLASHLVQTLDPKPTRRNHGVPKGDPFREYVVDLTFDGPVVADRYHIGERVYGEIVRGDDKLGHFGQELLEDVIMRCRDAVLVVCRPPLEVCIENWRGRLGDEYVKRRDWMAEIWEAYGAVETRLPVLQYDYTATSLEAVTEEIHAYIG